MVGRLDLHQTNSEVQHVSAGPLLTWMQSLQAASLQEYELKGGLTLLRSIARNGPDASLRLLDEANVRGRAGGGFPVALKWWLLAQSDSRPRYLICNANSFHTGFSKERYLLALNPYAVIETLSAAAYLSGADEVVLCVSEYCPPQDVKRIADAIAEFAAAEIFRDLLQGENQLRISMRVLPALYIVGEETALIEALEGREPQPRKKPPMPTASGYRDKPTVISNLESILQAGFALHVGPTSYRRTGTETAPGTLLFSVTGDVKRPGLYELPLGTNLQELVYTHAQGCNGSHSVKMVFPGGLCSAPVRREGMDIALDFDNLREAGMDIGSGSVIVVSESRDLLDVARQVADFYSDASCGKCLPCKDGTFRTSLMFRRLNNLDQTGVDWEHKSLPVSKRSMLPPILNDAPAGISYTDDVQGLDKIISMCEFFKHRGDCHFSVEAATSIQTMTSIFREEFEAARREASPAVV